MPKALCMIGLVISILVFLLFTLDLVLGLSGMAASAPFRAASSLMDVVFILSSGGLIYLSWSTFREQR